MLSAETGAEALRLIATSAPDVIVLDLGLPDMDGKEVLRRPANSRKAPVIILSARDRETEKIAALDLGADDYVEKPFGIGELTGAFAHRAAPRRARSRRAAALSRPTASSSIWTSRRVARDGQPIKLTPKEYELLAVLVRMPAAS